MAGVFNLETFVLVSAVFVVVFGCWVFWNFSRELWTHRRRRVRREALRTQAGVYWPQTRFRTRLSRSYTFSGAGHPASAMRSPALRTSPPPAPLKRAR